MPGVCRDNDAAGGDLVPSQTSVKANGQAVIVKGNTVAVHGVAPHLEQTIVAGSNNVKVGGVAVCNAGDVASVCGEAATGSANVNVG